MLLEQVYGVFGDNLPDKDTFFATTANPMCLLDLKREGWKTWDNFLNEYHAYAKTRKPAPEVKSGAIPAGVTKDAAK